ncbi:ABC transporter ATP-binding protein [Thalassovita sp.]|uniref:ABC transporter ATP-binding protein n=1 Tax=Thalassovita sp. TaxID=1979401 RepID=UPI002B2726C2|nr:ABC transporter ATP-binding protein [Thalassovita sp.]
MSWLEVENVSLAFGGLKAVDDLSFSVEPGKVFTIIGPNGAGKSTVFNLICRIYDPIEGDIRFGGESLLGARPHEVINHGIARTFQNIELFEHASLLDNLLIGRFRHGRFSPLSELFFLPGQLRQELEHRRKAEEVIEFLDLEGYRHARVADLPYGVRKKTEMARALVASPEILLLDEPSSGLTTEETDDTAFVIEDIREDLGITVVMIEHDMKLVNKVSDKVLAINEGRFLATGSASEVQDDPDVQAAYLGGEAT